MPESSTLHEALVDELHDIYDAEQQVARALPLMASAATSESLRDGLTAHLEETREHVLRVEQALAMLDESPLSRHCDGMAGILDEGVSVVESDEDGTKDARLIAAAQRVEHYEMAVYGTLVNWAHAMGHDEVAELLQMTLEEEKLADSHLTALAVSGINQQAAELEHGSNRR